METSNTSTSNTPMIELRETSPSERGTGKGHIDHSGIDVVLFCIGPLYRSDTLATSHLAHHYLVLGSAAQGVLLAIVLLFGMLGRLSNVANEITIDRNWLPLLASSSSLPPSETGVVFDPTHLNAVMLQVDRTFAYVFPLSALDALDGTGASTFTVLAWSSSMLTHLWNAGFARGWITTERSTGVAVEFGSTVITPLIVHRLLRSRSIRGGPSIHSSTDEEAEQLLVRGELDGNATVDSRRTGVLTGVGFFGIS
ncbi:hypothetical protein BJ546DRAFT_1060124 [Cryomyces antarcticus]